MSITCEPDVSRVLSKLGRRSFNYVSFGNGPVPPVTPPAAPGKLDSPLLPGPTPHPAPASRQDGSRDQSVAAAFSLLEAALPEAAQIQRHLAPVVPPPVLDDPPAARQMPISQGSTPPPVESSRAASAQPIVQQVASAVVPEYRPLPATADMPSTPVPPIVQSRLFRGGGASTPNPFPPRSAAAAPLRHDTTPMAAVFRTLAGKRQPETSTPGGPRFPFRWG
jgi:hypothetical protein